MIILAILASLAAIGLLCWLLFTLAVFALPAFVDVTAGAWVHGTGAGIPGAVLVGAVAAALTLAAGHLTRGDSFSGRIHTFTLDLELTIVPVEPGDSDNTPDYRVLRGIDDGQEVGAGWTRTSEKAGEYVSLQLDDPTFHEPIRARLFPEG